ncbi:hypothetical protein E2C01_056437 [Portunus trituberculatus]|uniref:Uncharacterized protein n=1 Tax=Portunus trituberculatus TaxID=210409 RepID=A0A5B7GXE7_PORTR|nr:hypothetical protein [Portunus trituberculatus]
MEGQSFTLQDPKDTSFFVTAMEVARNHLKVMACGGGGGIDIHSEMYSLLSEAFS